MNYLENYLLNTNKQKALKIIKSIMILKKKFFCSMNTVKIVFE